MPETTRTDSTTRRLSPIRAILSTVAVFVGGIALAVAAAGTSYAFLNASAPVSGATITAGTVGLTINNAPSATVDLTSTTLLPGRSVVQATPLQFKNTGNTPLTVTSAGISFTPASAALQPYLQISLRPTAATCTVTPENTPLPASIAPVSFATGQTVAMCLEVRLLANAPSSLQDAAAAFTINLNAVQVIP